jgi:hypothetical protein
VRQARAQRRRNAGRARGVRVREGPDDGAPLHRGGCRGWTDAPDSDQSVSMSAPVDADLGALVQLIEQGKFIGSVVGFVPLTGIHGFQLWMHISKMSPSSLRLFTRRTR